MADDQLVRIVADHARKLERIETLADGSSGVAIGGPHYSLAAWLAIFGNGPGTVLGPHHTLVSFFPGVSVATFGRMRLTPGTGIKYRVISWAIACNPAGSVVVDILKGSGYPPMTTMCGGNRPSCVGGNHSTGNAALWTQPPIIDHGDWLILNVFSFAGISQLGFSMELEPQVA
jgi:hypothetical protein